MKCLSIQLDLQKDPSFDTASLIDHIRAMGRFPEIDRDADNPQDIRLNFFTEDAVTLWSQLDQNLLQDKQFGMRVKQIATVVCEGDQGWDNHVLLWPKEDIGR